MSPLPLAPSLGIMAILFSGIVMSHYTHHNLSPVTQILMQQTLRTVAFLCGEFCSVWFCAGLPTPHCSALMQEASDSPSQERQQNSSEPRTALPYLLFATLAFRFHNVNLSPENFLEHLMAYNFKTKNNETLMFVMF